MSITLTNRSRRMRVFVLPHDSYCETRGDCSCTKIGGRRLATSLTLPAGSVTPDLDEAVLAVPDIILAAAAGELRVRRQIPPAKPKSRSRSSSRSSGRKKAR